MNSVREMSCSSQCWLSHLLFQVDTYSQTHIPDWHTPGTDSGRSWHTLSQHPLHSHTQTAAAEEDKRYSAALQVKHTLKEFIIWTCLSHYSVRLCVSDVFKCNCAPLEVRRDMIVRKNTSWRRMLIKEEVRQSRSGGFIRSAVHGSTLTNTTKT